ncbi:hypothetical protein JB92DRAFT_3292972 [Gautieria morchelliformis]|nr:hypothetical protein JB92DRAFT_3292972 [Gautieria morchelliformis]
MFACALRKSKRVEEDALETPTIDAKCSNVAFLDLAQTNSFENKPSFNSNHEFAYYANPHHNQGFWEHLLDLLDAHPWLTLMPRHPKDNNPCQACVPRVDGHWWWTVVPRSRSCKFDYKSRPKFRRAKITKLIWPDSDSEDVWADASMPSPSGDNAEGHDRKSTVMAVATMLNGAMPEQLEGQRQSIDHVELAAAGWQSPELTPEIGRGLVPAPLPSSNKH